MLEIQGYLMKKNLEPSSHFFFEIFEDIFLPHKTLRLLKTKSIYTHFPPRVFLNLFSLLKKLYWPNQYIIAAKELNMLSFRTVSPGTIFSPPSGICHRIWANACRLPASETGDRLTRLFI